MADCQAALNDPDSECNEGGGGEKYDCKHGTGCFQTPSGPYDSLQACEDSRDDHYNMGREDCVKKAKKTLLLQPLEIEWPLVVLRITHH